MNPVEMWNDFSPSLPEEEKRLLAKDISDSMCEGLLRHESSLYPGVEETLDMLKAEGYSMYLFSNCGSEHMKANVASFGLERWFSGFYSSGDYPGLTKSGIFAAVRGHIKDPIAMIGDRASDFDVARENGLKFIACLYGFGKPREFEGADAAISSFSELPGVLHRLFP